MLLSQAHEEGLSIPRTERRGGSVERPALIRIRARGRRRLEGRASQHTPSRASFAAARGSAAANCASLGDGPIIQPGISSPRSSYPQARRGRRSARAPSPSHALFFSFRPDHFLPARAGVQCDPGRNTRLVPETASGREEEV